MISYAQNFEDVMLERLFREVHSGFYVDVGAWDPTVISVTRHFYDRGWRGVNIEPIAARITLFQQQRPRDVNLCIAVGREVGALRFYECVNHGFLSTLDAKAAVAMRSRGLAFREYDVEVTTLNEVFAKYCPETVEFLKLDVEGFERELLETFDFRKFRPRALVIEAVRDASPEVAITDIEAAADWASWESGILNAGYVFAYFDGLNRFYLRSEDAGLSTRLKLPPGVYDRIGRDAELAQQAGTISELEKVARERLDLIQAKEAEYAKQAGTISALEKAASERLDLIHAKDVELAQMQEQINFISRQMWLAREEVRELENQIDQRRWSTWRSRLFAYVFARARWLAEGLLCQVFPPLPVNRERSLKISIVTPVFNNADTVRETIESVLNQDYPNFEYIIVDGGSTDGSIEIIQEYVSRLTALMHEPDQGMYDAIGKGFGRATGDILAYLNADDLYEHGALMHVSAAFRSNPQSEVIYFEDSVTVNGWRFPNRPQTKVDFISLFKGRILFQDGVFFSRRAYKFVGGINRTMRFAGDWELWVRLSYRFNFKRIDGHVSSFRIREGQLSQDMENYNAEVEKARKSLRKRIPRVEFWVRQPRHWWNKAINRLTRLFHHLIGARRLFFPIDFPEMPPPPGLNPGLVPRQPRCPIDDTPPTHLLFSSRDTRFGYELINYVYYHSNTDSVSFYPPLSREQLKDLYVRYYSLQDPELKPPIANWGSPYRNYRSRKYVLRFLSRVRLPHAVRAMLARWPDQSLEEIQISIQGLVPSHLRRPKFLDVGCFEGKLLDRLAGTGTWETFGIEPNERAAQIARDKGHRVWTVDAEGALGAIPSDVRFDIIFLGQTIEHFNQPLAVLVELSRLLEPHGLLVLSTPNLHSAQIDLFGPTWAHWHPPYHRYLFSPKSIALLAQRAGLRLVRCKTWSHPSWSWLSQTLHEYGLGGSVPHGIHLPEKEIPYAESLSIICRFLYDWRKKGDYMVAVLAKDFRGT